MNKLLNLLKNKWYPSLTSLNIEIVIFNLNKITNILTLQKDQLL